MILTSEYIISYKKPMAKKNTVSVKNFSMTVTGSNSAKVTDVIMVYGNNNSINARKGNDKITIFKGNRHKINGGAGKDTIVIKKGNSHRINGDDGTDKITLSAGKKTVIHGGAGNDTITVTGGSQNTIYGDKGNDKIIVAAKAGSGSKIYGDDAKNKLTGNDTFNINGGKKNYFYGGKGVDTFNVNGGSTNYIYGGSGNDVIVIGKTSTGTAVVKDFSVKSGNKDTVKVTGGAVKNIAVSGKNMVVKGGKSAALTLQNAKSKTFTVTDTLGGYTVSGSNVKLALGKNYKGTLPAASFITTVDARNDANAINIKGNGKNNTIYGGAGANRIYGYGGNDTLNGGAGNDTLYGGAGTDKLTGGAGKDTFVYANGDGKDTIKDYTAGQDTLQISSGAINKVALANSNKDIVFTIGSGTVTLTGAAAKAISLKDSRGNYIASSTTITLASNFTGTLDAGKFLSTVTTIDGRKAVKSVSITGNARNNTIYAGKAGGTIYGGAGNDRLIGGVGNDILHGGEGSNTLTGGEGNDTLIIDGRYNDTLTGGIGSDTYVISKKLSSDTVLHINQDNYQTGDADTLLFEKVNKEDVRYNLQGNVLSIMHSSGGTIAITGWDTNPLTSVTFANGNVSKAEIDDSLAVHSTQSVTQQNVIKSFMKALVDSTMIVESVESALNAAIRFASNFKYSSWNDLVSSFIGDIQTYAKMEDGHDSDWLRVSNNEGGTEKIVEPGIDRFLQEYCGITLLNEDTGSITGFDAGGGTVKTAESIVPETGTLKDVIVAVPGSSTTINGLTFHWKESVTEQEQNMMNAINTWWAKEGLALIEESYGLSFTKEETTVTDISVDFKTDNSSTLAYVTSWSGGDGKANSLKLTVNMKYYNELLDENGASDTTSEYLDRTIVHELTHAVMAANITGFKHLPKCIREGSAELVHGIDDERANEILTLTNLGISGTRTTTTTVTNEDGTETTTKTTLPKGEARLQDLQEALSLDGDNHYAYAGGYMLLHYFARQVADSFNDVASSSYPLLGSSENSLYNTSASLSFSYKE